jgi:hypothetical protein
LRRKQGDSDYSVDDVERRGDRVVVAFSWADTNRRRHYRAHALQDRDGKITDMQDFASHTRARAAIRLRTAFAATSR